MSRRSKAAFLKKFIDLLLPSLLVSKHLVSVSGGPGVRGPGRRGSWVPRRVHTLAAF